MMHAREPNRKFDAQDISVSPAGTVQREKLAAGIEQGLSLSLPFVFFHKLSQ